MKKKIILLILAGFFISPSFSQWKAKLADKHYNNLAYAEAAPMYNELANKFLKDGKGEQEYVLLAAKSNSKTIDYSKSNYYFEKYLEINSEGLEEVDYMTYIDQLKMLEDYTKARGVAVAAAAKYPGNSFFKAVSQDADIIKDLESQAKSYEIELQSFNTGMGDFSPFYYEDGLLFTTKSKNRGFLTGRFAWDNTNYTNVMFVKEENGNWKKAKVMRGPFFSSRHDGPVALSPNGTKMAMTRNLVRGDKKKGVRYFALYMNKKVADGKWDKAELFEHSAPDYNTGHATFSLDGNRMYFASDREGSVGGSDIFYSDYKDGVWGEPVNMKEINTIGNEMFPHVGADNKLYFASDGYAGLGGLDIYMVDLEGGDYSVTNLGAGINSSKDDFGIIVDSTGLSGYFTSNRENFVDKIYSWTRGSVTIDMELDVFANVDTGKEPIANQEVLLIDKNTNDTITLTTNAEGRVNAKLNGFKTYQLVAEMPDHESDNSVIDFNTRNIFKDTTFKYEMSTTPKYVDVEILVYNDKTKDPLTNAEVIVKWDSQESKMMTDENGNINMKANKNTQYHVFASMRGFINNNTSFKTGVGGTVQKEIPLTVIEKGITFKIDNIFYDLNKADLRPESEEELDKLSVFLLNNPGIKVELSSHTDSRGSDSYNMSLSQRRAQSCVNYLIKKGITKKSIIAKGYGETKLVNHCKNGVECSEEEHQLNRRTEIKILDVAKD